MRAKQKVTPAATLTAVVEPSGEDVVALAAAYRAGLIQAWKLDGARGYCLSRAGRADEYVEVDKLNGYLRKLTIAE
jgi:hypothetical protein